TYGLVLNDQSAASSFELIQSKETLAENPFTQETAPTRLKAKARRIPQWTTDENNLLHTLEPSPVKSDEPLETIELIPMGAARLRISSFPLIADDDRQPTTGPADRPQKEEPLSFQSHDAYRPRVHLNADVAMVYGIDKTLPDRIKTWRDQGYIAHVMTGVAWGEYQDYY